MLLANFMIRSMHHRSLVIETWCSVCKPSHCLHGNQTPAGIYSERRYGKSRGIPGRFGLVNIPPKKIGYDLLVSIGLSGFLSNNQAGDRHVSNQSPSHSSTSNSTWYTSSK